MPATKRRLLVGAEVSGDSQVAVRVWAPMHATVRLTSDDGLFDLSRSADGYFEQVVLGRPGSRYGFVLGDDPRVYPDPASRFQPDGPAGRSEVTDPSTFAWRDREWRGLIPTGQVLYEMHVGSFTREGTWGAAAAHLSRLRDLGVTAVQTMPIAEFAGAFGWGYDGVLWFAPFHHYGRPDDLRAFVDEAHQLGLGVILDVVYNHLGTDGNSLPSFSRQYISTRYENEWGAPLNFDGPGSEAVRALVLENVEYWITEFHMDGFRLDATQQIFDCSPESIMAAKLTHERDSRAERFWRLHRDLLALRRADLAFSAQRRPEGVCLGPRALLLRFGDPAALSTRLLLVNLESDAPLAAKSEPLLAPPTATGWRVLWSSEHPDYGGAGLPPWNEARWTLPAHAAVVLGAEDDGRARG